MNKETLDGDALKINKKLASYSEKSSIPKEDMERLVRMIADFYNDYGAIMKDKEGLLKFSLGSRSINKGMLDIISKNKPTIDYLPLLKSMINAMSYYEFKELRGPWPSWIRDFLKLFFVVMKLLKDCLNEEEFDKTMKSLIDYCVGLKNNNSYEFLSGVIDSYYLSDDELNRYLKYMKEKFSEDIRFKGGNRMYAVQVVRVLEKISGKEKDELMHIHEIKEAVDKRKQFYRESRDSFEGEALDDYEYYQIEFDENFIEKQFEKALAEGNEAELDELRHYCSKRVYIKPETIKKVVDFYSKDEKKKEMIERWAKEELDTVAKLQEAADCLKAGSLEGCQAAYWRYKWAGELKGELLNRIMEKLAKHISKEDNLFESMQYLRACLREDYNGDKELLKKLADKFNKRSKPEWELTCYYLLDDKEQIKDTLEKIKKELG